MSKKGIVFEIREFCLHDGPGIRTTVFFKGCPLRCAWCHNPEGFTSEPQLLVSRSACTACGACRKVCPSPDAGLAYPFNVERSMSDVRRSKDISARPVGACTACGMCVAVCPQGCRRLCGRTVTADELAAELLAQADVLNQSGGGVTFSGGEPLAQTACLLDLADRLRPLHLAIETSGYASPRDYQSAVSAVDLVLQDLKHPDPAEHIRLTGKALAPILENLAWLKASGKPFIARIPLIPGVNDTPDALAGFARMLEDAPALLHVELLPYHRTAGAKYALLGLPYEPPFDQTRPARADPSAFGKRGIRCLVSSW